MKLHYFYIALAFVITSILVSCARKDHDFREGDVVTVISNCDGVFDEPLLDEIEKYGTNSEQYDDLVLSGKVGLISAGTHAVIEDIKGNHIKIREKDGLFNWVFHDKIKKIQEKGR